MTGVQQALELQHAQDRAHLDAFHARSLHSSAPQSGPSERVRAARDGYDSCGGLQAIDI